MVNSGFVTMCILAYCNAFSFPLSLVFHFRYADIHDLKYQCGERRSEEDRHVCDQSAETNGKKKTQIYKSIVINLDQHRMFVSLIRCLLGVRVFVCVG